MIFVLKVEILHKNTNRHHPKIPSQNFLKKKEFGHKYFLILLSTNSTDFIVFIKSGLKKFMRNITYGCHARPSQALF